MTQATINSAERFQSEADKYAAYLKTPDGRLRLDLAFTNLQEFLPHATQSLHALDLGGGTGALTVRLAQLGIHVTLLDASLPMLDLARRTAQDAKVAHRIALQHGDASQLATLFPAGSFDLILCHNVLEFVDDPPSVLRSVARTLRPSGIISILVRNQTGEVLKSALVNADLIAAERNLTSEWGDEALYGGKVRLFTVESLRSALASASFTMIAERGVRVISDYLPPKISRADAYDQIFDLERKLGKKPEFAAMARYTHVLASSTRPEEGCA